MKKGIQISAIIALFVILTVGISLLLRTVHAREQTLVSLIRQKNHLNELRMENERLGGIAVDESEIARLRQENGDLAALRNRIRQLHEMIKTKNTVEPKAIQELRTENERLQEQSRKLQQLPDRAVCIKNLELIDAAKTRLIEAKNLFRGEPVTMDDLMPFLSGVVPACPDGGHYNVNRVGSPPTCSVTGHSIP